MKLRNIYVHKTEAVTHCWESPTAIILIKYCSPSARAYIKSTASTYARTHTVKCIIWRAQHESGGVIGNAAPIDQAARVSIASAPACLLTPACWLCVRGEWERENSHVHTNTHALVIRQKGNGTLNGTMPAAHNVSPPPRARVHVLRAQRNRNLYKWRVHVWAATPSTPLVVRIRRRGRPPPPHHMRARWVSREIRTRCLICRLLLVEESDAARPTCNQLMGHERPCAPLFVSPPDKRREPKIVILCSRRSSFCDHPAALSGYWWRWGEGFADWW